MLLPVTHDVKRSEDRWYPPLTPDDAVIWRRPGKRCTEDQAALLLNAIRPTRENLNQTARGILLAWGRPQLLLLGGPDPPPLSPPVGPIERSVHETREAIDTALKEGVLSYDLHQKPLVLLVRDVVEWAASIRRTDPDRYPGAPLLSPNTSPTPSITPSTEGTAAQNPLPGPPLPPFPPDLDPDIRDDIQRLYDEDYDEQDRQPTKAGLYRRKPRYGRDRFRDYWPYLRKGRPPSA